jgi:hypothetical protein
VRWRLRIGSEQGVDDSDGREDREAGQEEVEHEQGPSEGLPNRLDRDERRDLAIAPLALSHIDG